MTTYAPDSFDALHIRFMSLLSRLEVVREVLSAEDVPNEFAPAALVLYETTTELHQLYNDFESCSALRGHTPKEVQS